MGFLDYGLAAKAFADGFRQTYITDAEREKERMAIEEAEMQNKIRQAQLAEMQNKANLNAQYRNQLGLMSSPQLGNEQAPRPQMQGNFANSGLPTVGDPSLLNTPTREVLPSQLEAIFGSSPEGKMAANMLPYLDASQGMELITKFQESKQKGSITMHDLVKAATEGKLGPQGQAILAQAGYGGVFQAKPQDKKYDTEERYDAKSHTTYGRDFYWNEDGSKTYIGNERPIKGRESTSIHIGGTNPNQDRTFGANLRKEYNNLPDVKEANTTLPKIENMEKAYARSLKTKNFVAVDQALITLFNKQLDPTSVVRESEYARTGQNIPLLNAIKGKAEKVMYGGASLTTAERNELIKMARSFRDTYMDVRKKRMNEYRGYAVSGGLDPDKIFINTDNQQPTNNGFNLDNNAIDAELKRRKGK